MISLFKNTMEIALFSSVMIAVILLLKALFKHKLNIKIISFLWILILFRLIIPVTIESPIHISDIIPAIPSEGFYMDVFDLSTAQDATNNYAMEAPDQINEGIVVAPENSNIGYIKNEKSYPSITNKAIVYISKLSIVEILAFIWIIGAAISFFINLINIYNFNKKISEIRKIDSTTILEMIQTNKVKVRLKRNVNVYECDYIDAPITLGILKPKIIVPIGFMSSISPNKQTLIILHELCHIKKLDVAKNYAWLISRIIYWFNPLIPYAYKKYIEDAEILCDDIVLNTLSTDQRCLYSQSLIDAVKLSKGEIKLPTALSFYENKSNLRKRVEYMIKPTERLKSASFISLLIAALMIITCFSTACIPKAPIAINEYGTITNGQHIEYKTEPNKNTKIVVNADVVIPDYDKFSTIRLVPENLEKEHLDAFINYVLKDTNLYYSNIDAKPVLNEDGIYDGTISEIDENALHGTYTQLKAYTFDGKESSLELTQSVNKLNSQLTYWRYDDGHHWDGFIEYAGVDNKDMNKSYEECLSIAEDLISKIDGENSNFRLNYTMNYFSGTVPNAYRFFFYREFSSIMAKTYLPLWGYNSLNSFTVEPERITIFVDDEGVFEFWWTAPKKEVEIIEKNMEIITFTEAHEIFKKYCDKKINWAFNGEDVSSATINISKIELTAILIPEDESMNSYVLTPVWSFIGDITYYNKAEDIIGHTISAERNLSILAVNAINGSIIERKD